MFKIKLKKLVVSLYLLQHVVASLEIDHASRKGNDRESRKLFGGYRITPRLCKPTRKIQRQLDGPNICMFNNECSQRRGLVVGACMDGFLFGACCHLPLDVVGELITSDLNTIGNPDNSLNYNSVSSTTRGPLPGLFPSVSQVTLTGVSQISESLLKDELLPTAQDNIRIEIGGGPGHFNKTGVTHPTAPDTFLINNQESNEINPDDFNRPESSSLSPETRKTTSRFDSTTASYTPYVQISISNTPDYFSPKPYERPSFRPKPTRPQIDDRYQYVLIPTLSHSTKPDDLQGLDSTITTFSHQSTETNIYPINTSKRPASTYTYYTVTPTQKPEPQTVTKKPPSTSYVFSSTPIRPRPTTKPTTVTKKKPTTPSQSSRPTHPTKVAEPSTSFLYQYPTTLSNEYNYDTSYSPSYSTPTNAATTPKPTTSYYSPTTNKLPEFTRPPPTIIILGPATTESIPASITPNVVTKPTRRPVTHVTINNHVTHNLYTESPSPTVLITPKPTPIIPKPTQSTSDDYFTSASELENSVNELVNFPPVRNPNLNISVSLYEEITTPSFLEDDALNKKMETFVNKIVESLQEPFQGLKDVVYDRNTSIFQEVTTKKTTKKPTKTTSRPTLTYTKPLASTRKPTTRKPTTLITKQPTIVTKRPTTTKKIATTTYSYFDTEAPTLSNDFKHSCGVRPLAKTGRIVGGKGAAFGAFPWQVLVRESTWLGLFTKNKCGGVLISNRYVMTAAHCQPGFLASLVAVLGDHDISGERESKRAISRNVKRVIVHRQYDAATFENDLALLELEHPLQFDEHIVPICLPREGEDFTGRLATVTGWGRLKYSGGVPSILQEVQVPIMENQVCQEMFRTAGHNKVIMESFLCAGYANGQKDSCEVLSNVTRAVLTTSRERSSSDFVRTAGVKLLMKGDSGGPLVLQRPDGRYQLAGTVSHGIKCAAPYLPGVYMRTAYYKPWIESITGVH